MATGVTRKHMKYQPLVQKATNQKSTGRRKTIPIFYAPLVSHRCEISQDAYAMNERMASLAYRQAARTENYDGLMPKEASAKMRRDLKNSLVAAMARGWARQLLCAGYPLAKNSKGNRPASVAAGNPAVGSMNVY